MYHSRKSHGILNHDPLHHDTFLACRCFKRNLSLCALEVFMKNLDHYTDDELNCVKYFPPHLKTIIAHKFLTCRIFKTKKVSIKKMIALMLHDKLTEVFFTIYRIDDDIMHMLEVCTNLQKLWIDGQIGTCDTHNRDGTEFSGNLSENCFTHALKRFPEMCDLRIQNISAVTDTVAKAIAENCPKLQLLNLRNSTNLTDEGLRALLQLESLTALDISGSKVTDDGLRMIVESSFIGNAEDIRLNNCKEIKDFDLNLFGSKCKALKLFSCRGSPIADKMKDWNSPYLSNLIQINWDIEW